MTGRLTAAFLKANRITLYPDTFAQSAYIQQQLLDVQIGWGSENVKRIALLQESIDRGIVVDNGAMWIGHREKGHPPSADISEFPGYAPADAATIRLTKKFISRAQVIFFPATHGESRYIQSRLLQLGAAWTNSGRKILKIDGALDNGIMVNRGVMFVPRDESDIEGIVCDVRALSPHIDGAIDALTRRVNVLEERLARVLEGYEPKRFEKDGPGSAPAAPLSKGQKL